FYLCSRFPAEFFTLSLHDALPICMPGRWYEALIGHGVIQRLADVVPALVVHYGISYVPGLPSVLVVVVRGVAGAYVVLTVALSLDRKSTRLNSSHVKISYAVFCLT